MTIRRLLHCVGDLSWTSAKLSRQRLALNSALFERRRNRASKQRNMARKENTKYREVLNRLKAVDTIGNYSKVSNVFFKKEVISHANITSSGLEPFNRHLKAYNLVQKGCFLLLFSCNFDDQFSPNVHRFVIMICIM